MEALSTLKEAKMFSLLRFAKSTVRIAQGFTISHALNGALVVGVICVGLRMTAESSSYGDMGSFIEERVLIEPPSDMPLSGLDDFIRNLPKDANPMIMSVPTHTNAALSDGNYTALSPAWMRGVKQVVAEGRCNAVGEAFHTMKMDVSYQQAWAITESNCSSNAVGVSGEVGLFQPMPETCASLGIKGDLHNPTVNATCTARYVAATCKRVKHCSLRLVFLSHNRGASGALRVANPEKTEYLRKIDYVLRLLLRRTA